MPTFTALTTLEGEDAANALAQAIEKMEPEPTGVGVFEIEDDSGLWEVGAYFLEGPNTAVLELLAMAFGAKPFALSELPEIDWVAKVRRELSPVEAGRFFVYGSHDADKVPAGRVALQIEATVAFGTGHHGTTLGCLLALADVRRRRKVGRVLDLGTGSGVLAIAALKVGAELATGSDIDRDSVFVARENARKNKVSRFFVHHVRGANTPNMRRLGPYDTVFANILMKPLIGLAPEIQRLSAPGAAIRLRLPLSSENFSTLTMRSLARESSFWLTSCIS